MKFKIVFIILSLCDSDGICAAGVGSIHNVILRVAGRNADLDIQNYLRGFENVQFDLSQEHFSFNTNFQYSKDFGTTIATDPDLQISSLTIKARNIADVADVSLGRQFVFAGVGSGLIDGAVAKAMLFDRSVGVTAYGGTTLSSRVRLI